jgi:hypothetical protein
VKSVTSKARWRHLGWFFIALLIFPLSFYVAYARLASLSLSYCWMMLNHRMHLSTPPPQSGTVYNYNATKMPSTSRAAQHTFKQ